MIILQVFIGLLAMGWIDLALTIFLSIVMFVLCGYYIYIAKAENSGFDKSEFNRLFIYIMAFVLLILIVNGKEGLGIYFGTVLACLLGLEKIGEINIGKK